MAWKEKKWQKDDEKGECTLNRWWEDEILEGFDSWSLDSTLGGPTWDILEIFREKIKS